MSANGRKKTVIWLLGFVTLLSVLNVFNALVELNGPDSIAHFVLFNVSFGSMDTQTYFLTSAIVTFALFGIASFYIFSGLPLDPSLHQKLTKVEETLSLHSNMLENTQIGFFRKLDENVQANEDTARKINMSLDGMRKETTQSLENMQKETSANLDKQKAALHSIEEETKENTENVKKQGKELTEMKKKIEKISEEDMPKPKLTSQTRIEKLKGISPRLAEKLNDMSISTVSELLAADPATVAEKAAEMVETISNKQAEAQLLMVPGIDEEHAEMLVRVGVVSQKELSNQDPVQLYRGIAAIAKTRVDQGKMSERKIPTIEDVSSWVKQARL